eukprot:TRINITY_DN38192_c0_g1_i1.p1 TRINITY_DN38192_c0_g1~~TRINITY_DN38192_c0_g1_i1.p1  ORF type:complete len:143 (-),score=30.08 TRINITY_DN38192_c0_g1_i1:45-449(-)
MCIRDRFGGNGDDGSDTTKQATDEDNNDDDSSSASNNNEKSKNGNQGVSGGGPSQRPSLPPGTVHNAQCHKVSVTLPLRHLRSQPCEVDIEDLFVSVLSPLEAVSALSLIHIYAADEEDSVDLGGRRIIKKKKE